MIRDLCNKLFFWNVFRMIFTEWALIGQSLPCQHDAPVAAATSIRVWALFLQSLPCNRVRIAILLCLDVHPS